MSGDRSPGFVFSIEADSESLEEKIENQAYRDRLDGIVEDPSRDASEKLQAILEVGAKWLGGVLPEKRATCSVPARQNTCEPGGLDAEPPRDQPPRASL